MGDNVVGMTTASRSDLLAPKPAYANAPSGRDLSQSLRFLLSTTHGRIARFGTERDRRATPRVPVELCCEDRTQRPTYFRTTYDLSTFGLSTQGGDRYRKGTRVSLRLHLPDDLRRPLDLRAEVVGTHAVTGGMRLAFKSPSPQAVRRIHRYLFASPRTGQGQA